tara:strand:+ start:74 stop:496 length:423 start_codon:yes stop_codon:yes gene_type:complete
MQMVKIIRLVSGEEICCVLAKEQLKEKSNMLRLSEPMLIKYVPQINEFGISDYIALVKWVGFTNDKIITIPKDKILTIANATEPFTRRYYKLVETMNTKTQKLPAFVERDLNDDDYEEIDKATKLDDIKKFLDMPSKKIH